MKAVMISIQPKWCELIASGKKTIEVRKNKPKFDTPFKCYIYAIKSKYDEIGHIVSYSFRSGIKFDVGKVIGEFVCDRVYVVENHGSRFMINNDIALTNKIGEDSCLEFEEMKNYLSNKNGYAWQISDLVIYDKPKELGEFWTLPCEKSENYCSNCGYRHRTSYEYGEYDCDRENGRTITRPPQSWCYVEELK